MDVKSFFGDGQTLYFLKQLIVLSISVLKNIPIALRTYTSFSIESIEAFKVFHVKTQSLETIHKLSG